VRSEPITEGKSMLNPVAGNVKCAGKRFWGAGPAAVKEVITPIGFTPRLLIIGLCTQLLLAPVSINAVPVIGEGRGICWLV